MQLSQIARALRGLTLFAVGAMTAVNLLHLATATPPPATYKVPDGMLDIVVQTERRFAPFRAALHRRGIVGPIALFESPSEANSSVFLGDSFLAQFALIPVVLDSDAAGRRWALGNFSPDIPAPTPDGWEMAEDLGGGVVLLRRRDR